jgi:coenzyme F420-reducing hydrogenase alpha subunit
VPAQKISGNLATLAKAKPPTPGEDDLRRLRAKIGEARDLDLEIAHLSETISEKQRELSKIETEELPAMFENLQITSMGLDASGNIPAYDAKLKPYYSASIPKDPAESQRALDFIENKWKMPEIIKTSYVIDFGRGERGKAVKLAKVLKTSKIEYSSRIGVHASTLTAEVRRRFESGKPVSPKDLKTLGATVGKVVQLNRKKEDADGKQAKASSK